MSSAYLCISRDVRIVDNEYCESFSGDCNDPNCVRAYPPSAPPPTPPSSPPPPVPPAPPLPTCTCLTECSNPDQDPAGDWCFVPDECASSYTVQGASGTRWRYRCETVASPAPPVPLVQFALAPSTLEEPSSLSGAEVALITLSALSVAALLLVLLCCAVQRKRLENLRKYQEDLTSTSGDLATDVRGPLRSEQPGAGCNRCSSGMHVDSRSSRQKSVSDPTDPERTTSGLHVDSRPQSVGEGGERPSDRYSSCARASAAPRLQGPPRPDSQLIVGFQPRPASEPDPASRRNFGARKSILVRIRASRAQRQESVETQSSGTQSSVSEEALAQEEAQAEQGGSDQETINRRAGSILSRVRRNRPNNVEAARCSSLSETEVAADPPPEVAAVQVSQPANNGSNRSSRRGSIIPSMASFQSTVSNLFRI